MSLFEQLKEQSLSLPEMPGIYQYLDDSGTIIYIGKAKNLRKRVYSYFSKTQDNSKTQILVRKIVEIRHTVVDTEQDALLLENNLIKRYRPRYNILLKDDKTYPWIRITNEPFPRVFSTRRIVRDGSKYYGPYTSIRLVYSLIELIHQLFPLRNCNLNLSQVHIQTNKYKPCLQFHLKKCNAPCIANEESRDYDTYIDSINKILKGNIYQVIHYLKDLMNQYSEELKFELAADIKEKLILLESYQSKSTVVSSQINNVEVFGFNNDVNSCFVNYLRVVDGRIITTHTVEIKKKLDEDIQSILEFAIIDFRDRYQSNCSEIILGIDLEIPLQGVKIVLPKTGDKKKLLELSERNALYYKQEVFKRHEKHDPEQHLVRILTTMRNELRLSTEPIHIECFDNSNLQGTNPVSSCVVFRNLKPSRKEYRHYNVKTVDGPNDFATMHEVITRRYKRLLEEGSAMPQLIVVDGGKGQLSYAVDALQQLGIYGKVAIIGIAKRLEEIYFPEDSIPLYLSKNSEGLKVIQHARNEAHRFGITFHRLKRSKNAFSNEFTQIKGIGNRTTELLYKEFKTMANIKSADISALANIIGMDKARKMYAYLHS